MWVIIVAIMAQDCFLGKFLQQAYGVGNLADENARNLKSVRSKWRFVQRITMFLLFEIPCGIMFPDLGEEAKYRFPSTSKIYRHHNPLTNINLVKKCSSISC